MFSFYSSSTNQSASFHFWPKQEVNADAALKTIEEVEDDTEDATLCVQLLLKKLAYMLQ